MVARLCSFLVWALVAATAVFWGLRLGTRAPVAPPNAMAAGDSPALRADLTRLLGTPPVAAPVVMAAPEAASRFKLIGVMAPKGTAREGARRGGVALIAVDGKPPKAYAVGASLDGVLVLQSVSLRAASIGPSSGAEAVKLELPPPTPAATGSLPGLPAGLNGVNGVPPMPMPVPGAALPAGRAVPGIVPQFRPVLPGAPAQQAPMQQTPVQPQGAEGVFTQQPGAVTAQ